jgi:DNA processing protein
MLEYDVWFSLLRVSNKAKLLLLKEFGTTKNIWDNISNGIIDRKINSDKLKGSWDDKKIQGVINIISEESIKLCLYYEHNYPQKLKQIEDAPPILFYKGNIDRLNQCRNISIVGSRNYTNYGMNVTKIISSELSKNNINIISGMARGIDSCAHSACIENDFFTCAVLGCGVDVVYPASNLKIYNKICDTGCIISEFVPGTPPLNYNFPVRNRIISSLSDIVIIVEASLKSGSLITANYALEQGKDVFAVPGSIFSEHSKGCNKLIKEGAYPLLCVEDIFEFMNMNYIKDIKNIHQNCKPVEQEISSILNDSPIHIDDIIKITNIDIKQLYEVLFELQLKDEIMCLAGNYYVKNNKTI